MRGRRSGLLPLERALLEHAARQAAEGRPEFHGFAAAAALGDGEGGRMLTSRGTLYKALERLERRGHLTRRWEDAGIALAEGRPRRRLYRITASGAAALAPAPALVTGRLQERPV